MLADLLNVSRALPRDMMSDPSPNPPSASSVAETVVIERPPPGLARGEVAWPGWGIAALGGLGTLLGLGFILWRSIRGRARR